MSEASLFLLLLLSLNLCDTQAKVIFIAHLLTNSLSFMNIPQILSPYSSVPLLTTRPSSLSSSNIQSFVL